jgi:hypothetical protein
LTYPISERAGENLVLDGVEIGSIAVAGGDVFVSWYNHNTDTYGIDKVDWDNKISGAFFETRILPIYRREFANYTKFIVAYIDLPVDTEIEINYSKDYGNNWVGTQEIVDGDRGLVYAIESVEATLVQMKVIMTASENTSPVIESAIIYTS